MSCEGQVKSFSDVKKFGFITYQGTDVFFHAKDCRDGGTPQSGDVVSFDVEDDTVRQGQLKAINVTGGTGSVNSDKGKGRVAFGSGSGASAAGGSKGKGKFACGGWGSGFGGCSGGGANHSSAGSGTCSGAVKSFNDAKGWGFILYENDDVFLHVKDCVGSRPQTGDWVNFDVEEDSVRQGQKKAVNVTGGTAPLGSSKGKGFEKGGGNSYAPVYGGKGGGGGYGMGCSPYGGGCQMGGFGWGGNGWDMGWGGGYVNGPMKGMQGMKGTKGMKGMKGVW